MGNGGGTGHSLTSWCYSGGRSFGCDGCAVEARGGGGVADYTEGLQESDALLAVSLPAEAVVIESMQHCLACQVLVRVFGSILGLNKFRLYEYFDIKVNPVRPL